MDEGNLLNINYNKKVEKNLSSKIGTSFLKMTENEPLVGNQKSVLFDGIQNNSSDNTLLYFSKTEKERYQQLLDEKIAESGGKNLNLRLGKSRFARYIRQYHQSEAKRRSQLIYGCENFDRHL